MSYSHIVSSNFVSVMNLETGNVVKIQRDDPAFDRAVDFIKSGDFESVEKMTFKEQIKNISSSLTGDFSVWIADGNVNYQYKSGESKILHNAMTDRMIRMAGEGFNMDPMMKFMGNLLANPSKTAIDELYLFLEATELPITDDGHFIAYKIVRNDYTSHYDQKFKNELGTMVEMPRNEVCDNRNLTCSYGLHFCSKDYLRHYGSTTTNDDRLILVKINPADVVSIPSDYNNAKGRASKYLIWKDITEENWRDKYCKQDYNEVAVEITQTGPKEGSSAFYIGYSQGYEDGSYDAEYDDYYENSRSYKEQLNYEEGYMKGYDDAEDGASPRYVYVE